MEKPAVLTNLLRNTVVFLLLILLNACKESDDQYNGYIDADLTYLSSNFSGRVAELLVTRGQSVKKNQLLFKLEQTSEHFSLAESQFATKNLLSQRKEFLDQIDYSEKNFKRTQQMRQQNAASQNDLDLAKRELDVLKNQLQAIDFQIKSSHVDSENKQWQVLRKENYASSIGIVFDTYFTDDEFVQAGQPVVSLITKEKIKVVFFIPESALSQIRLNQKVTMSTDGNLKFATGTINYISKIAQYTSPLIYSRENRQGLVFRIEARIDHPDLEQIHLGQPVTLETTRNRS